MKKYLRYSPPFSNFLVEAVNTGRMLVFEKLNMDGADEECADSG